MNALNQTIYQIKESLQGLPFDRDDVVHKEDLFSHLPNWETLPTPEQILGEMPIDVGEDVSVIVLGSYRPMCSPGIITLNASNLHTFYWSVLKEISRLLPGFSFSRQDLEFLVDFIVEKTWHHELFHHSMEVLRLLVNGQPYLPHEESLAVAYSRQCLREKPWNSKIGRLGRVVLNHAMDIAFQGYSYPYNDWHRYDSPERLCRGIVDLLQPAQKGFLESAGIPVTDLFMRLIPIQDGFHERVI